MPRQFRRISISREARRDLQAGLSVRETLSHIRLLSDHPENYDPNRHNAWCENLRSSMLQVHEYIIANSNASTTRQTRINEIRQQCISYGLVIPSFVALSMSQETILVSQATQSTTEPPRGTIPLRPISRSRRSSSRPTPVIEATDETVDSTVPFNINYEDFNTTMTFGIEIECLVPIRISDSDILSKLTSVGINVTRDSYGHDENSRDRHGNTTRTAWKLTSDGSVRSHTNDLRGSVEIVSPILKGKSGLVEVNKVCKVLAELNITVNKTCGLHVHHGAKTIFGIDAEKVIINACYLYKNMQKYFNKMLPKSRHNNQYARNISTTELNSFRDGLRALDRYRVVNTASYWRHGTLEFRQHSGTVEPEKIINWIKLTQKVMIRAKELLTNDIWSHRVGKLEVELNLGDDLKTYYKTRVERFAHAETQVEAA